MNKKYKTKAVFIDRDGCLIKEMGYLNTLKNIKFYKNSIKALKLLKQYKYKIIVVTNQAGVAYGYFPESFVKESHRFIAKKLKKYGLKIDAYYYCPHHKKAKIKKYKKNCKCRKPATGMIHKAKKRFNIDLKKSYTIGDKLTDVKLGHNSGMKGILVLTGFGRWQKTLIKKEKIIPDYIAKDFFYGARWIIKNDGGNKWKNI
ncbi:MAG: HAD family hydrolase [Candidatus Goldbacteria bacterium]|nr:HAD family hydrolase [Candidatus Goldiibacteriota bacterium]